MLTFDEQRNMIFALREKTGEGMMHCHNALRTCDWDWSAAVDHIRNSGNLVNKQHISRRTK